MIRRDFLLRLAGMSAPLIAGAGCGHWKPVSVRRRVGVSVPKEAEILNEFCADMKREAQRPGVNIDLVLVDAEDDPVKQFTDIEAFVAQRYGGIFMFVLPDGMDRIVARAVAHGVCVFNHSASPITGCTQNIVVDHHTAGYQVGKFAAQWINERHGGTAQVGLLTSFTDPGLIVRSQGLRDGLRENCPGAQLVSEVEADTVDKGAAAAANMLQARSSIKALLAFGDDPGVGAYTAATEAGKTNPVEFLVASADGTRLGMDKVALGGIYQCCAFFFFSFSATQAVRDLTKCLGGQRVSPTRIVGSKVVTKDNVAEYQYISAHPTAPEYAKFYEDPMIMRFSDVPLKTPTS